MMKNKRKIALFSILGSLILGLSALAISTYALFSISDLVNQSAYGTAGRAKVSLFLDCDTAWGLTEKEAYYAYVWKDDGTQNPSAKEYILPSKTVSITVDNNSGDERIPDGTRKIYVYEFDSVKYDRLVFTRCNTEEVIDPKDVTSSAPEDKVVVGSATWWDEYLWGRTNDITYGVKNEVTYHYNYYYIPGYPEHTGVYATDILCDCIWKNIDKTGEVT